eukprot:8312445-Pyramimonas_sp.AAC.1
MGLVGAASSQQLRLRRSQAPALLYRSNDSPSMRGCAISSSRKILLVSIAMVRLAARRSHICAAA